MTTNQAIAGTTILLAEDEYLLADDLARDLVEHGLTVLGPVATLDAALAAVAEQRPDLAVLDINLRGRSVFPLADLLQARQVPFIFATGYDVDAIPDRFATVPRHGKPLQTRELLAVLDKLADDAAPEPVPGC
jgi:DNA-binding response OmpR family regulator